MKPKTMILLGVAVVCGLAAAYLTSEVLKARNKKVQILVAREPIKQWVPIKEPAKMFEAVDKPVSEVPEGFVPGDKIEELKGRSLKAAIEAGTPVTALMLQDPGKIGLEGTLKEGMRAVAINCNAASVVAGFVQPNSHVDVVHNPPGRGTSEVEPQIVLQNILVLAVDLTSTRDPEKPGAVPATVTLEVTPKQAVELAKVKETGTLWLLLRPFGDTSKVEVEKQPGIKTPQIVERDAEPKVKARRKEDVSVMTIFNGQNWIKATHTKVDGQVTTEIEKSSPSEGAVQAPAPAAPAPRGSGEGK